MQEKQIKPITSQLKLPSERANYHHLWRLASFLMTVEERLIISASPLQKH